MWPCQRRSLAHLWGRLVRGTWTCSCLVLWPGSNTRWGWTRLSRVFCREGISVKEPVWRIMMKNHSCLKRQRGLERAGLITGSVWRCCRRTGCLTEKLTITYSSSFTCHDRRLTTSLLVIGFGQCPAERKKQQNIKIFVNVFVHYFPVSQPETQSILVMTVNTPGGTRGRSLFTRRGLQQFTEELAEEKTECKSRATLLPIHFYWIQRNIWFGLSVWMWTEELADGEIMAALFIYFTMTLKMGRFYAIIYHLQPF